MTDAKPLDPMALVHGRSLRLIRWGERSRRTTDLGALRTMFIACGALMLGAVAGVGWTLTAMDKPAAAVTGKAVGR